MQPAAPPPLAGIPPVRRICLAAGGHCSPACCSVWSTPPPGQGQRTHRHKGGSIKKRRRAKVRIIQHHPKHLEQFLAYTKCSRHASYYYYNSTCFPNLVCRLPEKDMAFGFNFLPNAYHKFSIFQKKKKGSLNWLESKTKFWSSVCTAWTWTWLSGRARKGSSSSTVLSLP